MDCQLHVEVQWGDRSRSLPLRVNNTKRMKDLVVLVARQLGHRPQELRDYRFYWHDRALTWHARIVDLPHHDEEVHLVLRPSAGTGAVPIRSPEQRRPPSPPVWDEPAEQVAQPDAEPVVEVQAESVGEEAELVVEPGYEEQPAGDVSSSGDETIVVEVAGEDPVLAAAEEVEFVSGPEESERLGDATVEMTVEEITQVNEPNSMVDAVDPIEDSPVFLHEAPMQPKSPSGRPIVTVEDDTGGLAPLRPAPVTGRSAGGRVRRQPVISYYRRMLLNKKMYSLVVKLAADEGAGGAGPAPTVSIEPMVPGCLVTPSRAEIQATPGAHASFGVVPLARGRLSGARVDFKSGGRLAGSEDLRMKVGGRKFTCFLFLVAIAIPSLIIYLKRQPTDQPLDPFFHRSSIEMDAKVKELEKSIEQKAAAANAHENPDLIDRYHSVLGENMVKDNLVWVYEQTLKTNNIEWIGGALFLVLALLSWMYQSSSRGRKRGKALEIGMP